MGYYSTVARDINKIPDAIQHFETELSAARVETKLKGNVEMCPERRSKLKKDA